MSAPQTNVATQTRWHRGPIIGMIVVVLFALGLLFTQMVTVAEKGQPAGNGMEKIDGRTGAPVPGTAPAQSTMPDSDAPTVPDGDIPSQTPAPPPAAPVPDTTTQP